MKEIKDVYDLLGYIDYDCLTLTDELDKLIVENSQLLYELGIYIEYFGNFKIILKTKRKELGYLLCSLYFKQKGNDSCFLHDHQSLTECLKRSVFMNLSCYKVKDIEEIIRVCKNNGVFLELYKDDYIIKLQKVG